MEPEAWSPPLVPVIIWINTVHALPSCSLKYILTLSSHLRLCRPSDLFPSGFSTKSICISQYVSSAHENLFYDKMLLSM